jgi:hypothetical protein
MKAFIFLVLLLSSIALAEEGEIDFGHKFDGVDASRYHRYVPGDQFPLMEALVIYMCVTQDCQKTWDAYFAQNTWVKEDYENVQHAGQDFQKAYLPTYAGYFAAPIIGAVAGHGELRISHNEVIVLNLRQPSLGYKYEF